jgi:hypothetical protein
MRLLNYLLAFLVVGVMSQIGAQMLRWLIVVAGFLIAALRADAMSGQCMWSVALPRCAISGFPQEYCNGTLAAVRRLPLFRATNDRTSRPSTGRALGRSLRTPTRSPSGRPRKRICFLAKNRRVWSDGHHVNESEHW